MTARNGRSNGRATDGTRRLAALDVGTNSIRLIVAEARPDGSYRLLDDEKEVTRLGEGFASTGELSLKAMQSSAMSIARMKAIAHGYGVDAMRVVGTCAVREATNQKAFLKLVKQHAGIDLEVISAEEEGRLAHVSVNQAFDIRHIKAGVVDIGGGSTEVVLSSGGVIEQIGTLPLGAVRLTEMFEKAKGDDERRFKLMREHIRKTIKAHLPKPAFVPQTLIGTGGTFTTLAAIAMLRGQSSTNEEASSVRGYELQRSTLKHLLNQLRSLSPRERRAVPGLSLERAEIIVAGMAIVDGVMRRLKANTIRVHDRGIRDGLILGMIRQFFPHTGKVAAQPPNRLRTARQFAESCHYEKAHSEHVAALAVSVFDQLARRSAGASWSKPVNRELLEAAGVLHDIGYYINYAKHHKHSYHLIVHGELPGFTHREVEIIANIARYHRRSIPKASHSNFATLGSDDQQLVRRLSAILRIVDGLDRAHAQQVKSVTLRIRDGAAVFRVDAVREPAVDLWGAERKAELFAKSFGLKPRFEWAKGGRVELPRKRLLTTSR